MKTVAAGAFEADQGALVDLEDDRRTIGAYLTRTSAAQRPCSVLRCCGNHAPRISGRRNWLCGIGRDGEGQESQRSS
jgi:hypothetical protein